ncbi:MULTISPECIES: hypothetical protein [Fusobacterium]|uniref:hypothetical protein n=1 Tax=Fusobacterium TaxID=848 RepID=UPI0025C50C55|nr:hypothetical protein [Fusobacterium sp.]MCI5724677.1 hypothetical protein [Fusobacterium sp.]MCI7223079.1 hypothetical protein [Fusobacterium sp.]MDD7410242.1 hypothetical protein [Fusobacteriaceae bacterium]MDY5712542.1 hypothetical protein [Fusobacterium gastrosuis]
MKFLEQKIKVSKIEKRYYKFEKNISFLEILTIIMYLIFFYFSLKTIIDIFEKTYGINRYILLTVSIIVISIYITSLFFNISKEILEITKDKIYIKKLLFSYCYYNKEILVKNITLIKYSEKKFFETFIFILVSFYKDNNTIIIQSKTDKEEDEEAYFGVGLKLKEYSEICKEIKEIIGNDYKNIEFTQFLR